jgi:hypothetical protein
LRLELQIETRWPLTFLFKPHSHCSLYYVSVSSPPSTQNPAIASCLETLESSSYFNRIYAPSYAHDRIMSCINFNPPTCLSDTSPSSRGHQFKEIQYYDLSLLFAVLRSKVYTSKVSAINTIISILWLITVLKSGNVLHCNTETLSDLCIWGPSQTVIPFNTMATLFVIVHNCPHITEYYYYCNDLWLFFFSEPIISRSRLILLNLLSHVTSNITL